MAGYQAAVDWNGRRVFAWVPDLLADRPMPTGEATIRRTERAAAAAVRASDRLPPGWEPLARLLLRAEGVASSFIEGVRAPLPDIAAAEVDPAVGEPAEWVSNNLAVVAEATQEREATMSVNLLHAWHRRLLAGPRTWLPEEMVGRFRAAQGWIGGTSPLDASLVTAPPDAVPALMDDLVAYLRRDDVDPVTQAAVAHAQFECIHPYGDGNGRIGRVLIGWVLVRRLGLAVAPPVSVPIAADRGGYLAGLTQFRLGTHEPWVRWFADVVRRASDATGTLLDQVHGLQDEWRARLATVRADSAAHRIVDLLPRHPVLSAGTVAVDLGVSERAARSALGVLAEHGVVEPFAARPGTGAGRPRHWWVAADLLTVVSRWSGT